MKKLILILIPFFFISMRSDKPAYSLFNDKGKSQDYADLLKDAEKADVVFFGELHNSPICHWLELELMKDLYESKKSNLIVGAEMFEADNQLIVNEYLDGRFKAKNFEDDARLWPNYKTDYKPLLEFAKKNKLAFIATNVPRRYAVMVNNHGFAVLDSLDPAASKLMVPRPFPFDPTLKCYSEITKMTNGGSVTHDSLNLARAQALKDATMAYFIGQNLKPGKVFLHFNGTYHSEKNESIIWYLKKAHPELKILAISSVEQDKIEELEADSKGLADYILCLPSNMTQTR